MPNPPKLPPDLANLDDLDFPDSGPVAPDGESTEPTAEVPSPFETPPSGGGKKTLLIVGGGLVALGVVGAVAFFLLAGKEPPPPEPVAASLPAVPALPPGPWDRHDLPPAERTATEEANAAAPAEAVLVGPNRVEPKLAEGEADKDAPLVTTKLPGKDRAGNDQSFVARLPTAQVVVKVAEEVKAELGLLLRVHDAWRSTGALKALAATAPALAAFPDHPSHTVNAVDISRLDADGKTPLTLDVEGKVIMLEDLKTPEGADRFREVVKRIEKPAPAGKRKKTDSSAVDAWVESAEADFHAGVWGMQDVTMETWRKHGWTTGHCSEVKAQSWHAQPIRATTKCERFGEDWVKNVRAYRQSPPPSEEYLFAAMELAKKGGDLEPYIMAEPDRLANDEVNATLPANFALVAFNRVSPGISRKVEDPDALLVYVKSAGKDRKGNPQRLLARSTTAEFINKVAADIKEQLGLDVRLNFIWRNNATQQRLKDELPKGMAASPGTSNHFVAAVDVSRVEANGKDPLTLDTEGKVIFLEDLATKEGAARFQEVIKRIMAKELKKSTGKRAQKIVDSWVQSAKKDYENGVWGLPDATMDIWRKHGWTTSHCGELSTESWHTEPIDRMKKCERWDDTYNTRIAKYRKTPPPNEEKTFNLIEAILAKPPPPKGASKKACKGFGCQLQNAIKGVGGMFGGKKKKK